MAKKEPRSEVLTVRVTKEELDNIDATAEENSRTRSDQVRWWAKRKGKK
jgi:hypothetical protein